MIAVQIGGWKKAASPASLRGVLALSRRLEGQNPEQKKIPGRLTRDKIYYEYIT